MKKITEDQYDYFSQWYHCIIRELACLVDFKDDYRMLARCVDPPITSSQAQSSVELLLRLGFLLVREGRYVQSEPVVATGSGVSSHRIVQFQIEMLKKAIDSFVRHQPDRRMTSSTTLAVSCATYGKLVGQIRELRERFMEMARNDQHPDRVCQLNINLFPVGEIRKGIAGDRL